MTFGAATAPAPKKSYAGLWALAFLGGVFYLAHLADKYTPVQRRKAAR